MTAISDRYYCRLPTGYHRRKTIRQRFSDGDDGAGDDGNSDAGEDGSLERQSLDVIEDQKDDVLAPEGKVKTPDEWQMADIDWD